MHNFPPQTSTDMPPHSQVCWPTQPTVVARTQTLADPQSLAYRRRLSAVSATAQAGDALFRDDKRPVVLYDGVCNMCNGAMRFALDNDRRRALRFASLQSEAGKQLLQRVGRAPDDISSIVFVKEDGSYTRSDAVLEIGKYLNLPVHQLSSFGQALVPQALRDFAYDQVANNRYNVLGKSENIQPVPAADPGRFLA